MESVASNNTRAVINNCPVFAGGSKDAFHEYKSKLRACPSLYSKPVFEVFKARPRHHLLLWAAPTPRRLMP